MTFETTPTATQTMTSTAPLSSSAIPGGTENAAGATTTPGTTSAPDGVLDPYLKRRKDEAVFRLVTDITRHISISTSTPLENMEISSSTSAASSSSEEDSSEDSSASSYEEEEDDPYLYQDASLTAAIASSIERGIDKEFFQELIKTSNESCSSLARICQDHSEVFLESVGNVIQLTGPTATKLKDDILKSDAILRNESAADMLLNAKTLEETKCMDVRARTMSGMVLACRRVAVLLEKAKRNAALCRPRNALDAVEEARACLTAPISSLLSTSQANGNLDTMLYHEVLNSKTKLKGENESEAGNSRQSNPNSGNNIADGSGKSLSLSPLDIMLTLEETPFGARAMEILPKIENEVMMGARRGLNKWFLALRSGGDAAKAGAAALRKCASSSATGGAGGLGLGGNVRGYEWRALNADNFIGRILTGGGHGRVAASAKVAYSYPRDCIKEMDRLRLIPMGMQRKAEAFAAAFGWYRCWEENASLGVDVSDLQSSTSTTKNVSTTSRFALGSIKRSATGSGTAGGSGGKKYPLWASLLTPVLLFEDAPSRDDDASKLAAVPESVHPVRQAEIAYALLGRLDEFRTYYEQNRFGDVKIEGREARSSLSSLTGDDVYHGTDRIFFAKSLPHLCFSVVGFSVVEAALEIGHYTGEDFDFTNPSSTETPTQASSPTATVNNISASRESSSRYERSLISELGTILRERAANATLAESVRASKLMVALRSALKLVHPSSSVRKSDRELLAIDVDIIMNALKKSQEEQLKYTSRVVKDDRYEPMKKVATTSSFTSSFNASFGLYQKRSSTVSAASSFYNDDSSQTSSPPVPEEVLNLPFGLSELVQTPSIDSALDFLESRATRGKATDADTAYTFSYSVPHILRSIHGRAIAFAQFCFSQSELGQIFPQKKGGGAAAYVLDTIEECIKVSAVAMKGGYEHFDELTVSQAVQITANLSALQSCLPRLFGTLLRGLCHVGMIRDDSLEDAFLYADKTLLNADKAVDKEVGKMYSLVFEITRNKIDTLMNFSLENFNWVAKSFRDYPNPYCESLIEYMRNTFRCLGPMDEGSRTGLHFSCCGHIAKRLVDLLCTRPDKQGMASRDPMLSSIHGSNHGTASIAFSHGPASLVGGGAFLSPISKIDVYAIKNLALDVKTFETFAEGTGITQLSDSFQEIKCLTNCLLDKDLPQLLLPENSRERARRYPFLHLEKLGVVLEKYIGLGMGVKMLKSSKKTADILVLDKNEVKNLLKLIRRQV